MFADRIQRASWLPDIDGQHPFGGDIMSAIFLGSWWKKDVRHWRSLERNSWRVDTIFESLPKSSTILEDYLQYLYYIGDKALPEAFIRIANRIQWGNPANMLRGRNTIYILDRSVDGPPG